MLLCTELVYHNEDYFEYPLFPYNAQFWKEIFLNFYCDGTVDIRYKKLVDNMISVVFHDNHWWHFMFHNNYSLRSGLI